MVGSESICLLTRFGGEDFFLETSLPECLETWVPFLGRRHVREGEGKKFGREKIGLFKFYEGDFSQSSRPPLSITFFFLLGF